MSDVLELSIERPVAGGRMLARHDGRVVFVSGAIPGERVRARVERAVKQSLWAATTDVMDASPDRRDPICDPACGGLAFAHIRYERQLDLKAQIIVDAFRRLARMDLDATPTVASSPESGYRLRARLQVQNSRIGFFREGTHALCDAGATQQMLPGAIACASAAMTAFGPLASSCDAVVVSENVEATERVLHLESCEPARCDDLAARARSVVESSAGAITGVTTTVRGRLTVLAGTATVTDTAASLLGAVGPIDPGVSWTRHASSFFQGNRFLTGALIRRVLDAAPGDRCIDLYAGVGLFSVALASRGSQVVAVEGDSSSGDDLIANARPWGPRLRVVRGAVEDAARHPPTPLPDVIIVDPPRTGMSAEAVDHLAAWGSRRLVYVSCDPPTLARDAARLAQRGLTLTSLEAFDMFPNTPHVESVAVFVRAMP